MSETIAIPTPDGEMPGHVWVPRSGRGPGVLLLQEIFGISDYIERRAQDLADLGYVVLAPEIYWRLGVSRVENGPDAMEQAFGLMQRTDWDTAVADGLCAFHALEQRTDVTGGTGIVGFCFGGGLGFAVAARCTPDALVSYYGSALPSQLGLTPDQPGATAVDPAEVTATQLHHFGLADSFVERAVVERVRERLESFPQVTFETYDGADHAFDNDDFHLHHPKASALAWERTAAFLRSVLPPG